jgi:Zn-dependent protease
VLLAVFNMIPIPPLDGGNVLAGLVPESIARMIDMVRPWGFLILYVLMFQGVIGRILYPVQLALVRWLL